MAALSVASARVEISKTYSGQIDPVNTVTVKDKKIGGTVKPPKK